MALEEGIGSSHVHPRHPGEREAQSDPDAAENQELDEADENAECRSSLELRAPLEARVEASNGSAVV